MNGANIDTEENRSKSAAYENGEEISFANNQEALDWGGYYARQYRFANEDAPGFKRATGPQTRQTKWKVQWGKCCRTRECLQTESIGYIWNGGRLHQARKGHAGGTQTG